MRVAGANSRGCRGFRRAPARRLAHHSGDFAISAYRGSTLQCESWTRTPPEPPKAPKANPAEPVSLPGALGASTSKVETPNITAIAREGAANGDSDNAGAAIIAPGDLIERFTSTKASEPGFFEPWTPQIGGAVLDLVSIRAAGKWEGDSVPPTAILAVG
jgi:hypothetical protein